MPTPQEILAAIHEAHADIAAGQLQWHNPAAAGEVGHQHANAVPPPPPNPFHGFVHAHQQWQVQAVAQAQVNVNPADEFEIPHMPEEDFPMPQFVAGAVRKKKAPEVNTNILPSMMQEIVNYPPLKLNKTAASSYEKGRKPKDEPFVWTTQQGYVGIEIEVENITNQVPTTAYWSAKPDGSLRNNGMEYVSVPLAVKQIQLAIEHLYDAMYSSNNPDFSNRTSVHIHVNCRDMTQDQVYNFILLYAIFEKHFFSVAGTKRLNSIYCVPLFRCNILRGAKDVIYGQSPSWQKYCAINLLPLIPNNQTGCYGTIEFRHLYGTANPKDLMLWINDILCLRKWAMTYEKQWLLDQIKEMNTTSQYLGMYNTVFEGGRKVLTDKRDFEDCISNVKRELFGNTYWDTLKRSDMSPYWALANKMGIRG